MSERDLKREISCVTGESIGTIAGIGLVELRPIPFEREPLMMDRDEYDTGRNESSRRRNSLLSSTSNNRDRATGFRGR